MKKIIASFILILLSSKFLISQPGKDGAYTVNTANQVLNLYAPVSANVASGTNNIELANGGILKLCAGDLIMIYQAQGAGINNSNTASYGDILAYNGAGLYEFQYVQSSVGNTLTIQNTFTHSYQITGKVQVIKVPQFTTLTINPGAGVAAKAWKDTVINTVNYRFGGVLALHCENIVNNGILTANGKGFRGGMLANDNLGINTGAIDYCAISPTLGAEKGESIAGAQSDYDLWGGRYGMGAPANGGGGGNNHNAGGGGGANGFNGNAWNGQGVMIVNTNNPIGAWSLSAAYMANSNSLTNSSGGGHGGYSWGDANANALIQGPGHPAWLGDNRREVGGLGGRPLLTINPESRLFFGGGGGAPHENNNSSSSGSNGGGLIFLIVTGSITGSGTISCNGLIAGNASGCSCDAAPGGGAGGSVIIKCSVISNAQTISANGGNGGNQLALNFPGNNAGESEGPGGGGGGGYVALSGVPLTPQVYGGLNGTSLSGAVTEMISNGATQGASGQTGTVSLNFPGFIPLPNSVSLTASCNPTLICSGGSNTLNASGALSYTWQPGNIIGNPILVNPIQSTNYTVTAADLNGCKTSTTVYVAVRPAPQLSVSASNLVICYGGTTTLTAFGANSYSWIPGNFTGNSILIIPPASTVYSVTGTNSLGCTASSTIAITVSECLGLKTANESHFDPELYPNPNHGTFIIKGLGKQILYLTVLNSLGSQLIYQAIDNTDASQVECNLSELPSGIYFLSLKTEAQVIINKKLLIE